MNKKMLTISLLIVLTIVCIASAASVKAQTPAPTGTGWITQYTISDAQTGANIVNGQILEGEELKVEATINIPTSDPSVSLTLSTQMQHSAIQQNMYWQVVNGYSLGTFNPNLSSISFTQTAGTLVIDCYGKLPMGVQQTAPNGVTLDVPIPITLVSLQDPTGAVLGQINMNVTDSNIDNYLNLLSHAQASLKSYQSSGVDPGFISIYSNVISASEALEEEGFATSASTMLQGLSSVAAPASASMQALFLPIVGVVAVIAVVFAFLFFRIRGKVSYFQLVVEDQIKDLEGLTLRVSKIDRTASSNLESVKERLKRLVGM